MDLACRRVAVAVAVACIGGLLAPLAGAQVLRVGGYKGIAGQFKTIQAAVDAAKPGDWVLIGPGDYKTSSSRAPNTSLGQFPSGVLISTKGLTLRGMNRRSVVVDGTKPGSSRCSSSQADQNFGPRGSGGAEGLNGIMVWKADNVAVENLTACNFLAGPGGSSGNEIWWNGGAGSYKIGGWGFNGSYLTTTSTFYNGESTAAQYGIFSSDWSGGIWAQDYASNFNDSGFYIGACQQVCDQTVNRIWSEYNALGYSGSNSGGALVVKNSQFDNNEDGFDTNSQNGDEPSPQNGACPNGGVSPITHTHSCWVFMHNYVHDNNNPNVPSAGLAAAGPVGTGMSVSGGRNDTIMDNTFSHNGAWGTIFVPFPDSGPPCIGGTNLPGTCLYDEFGDALLHNTYSGNGFFGNPTNGDIGAANLELGPTDCYSANIDAKGLTTSPAGFEQTYPSCTGATVPPNLNITFISEAACDSQSVSLGPLTGGSTCMSGDRYPRRTQVIMHPLPASLPTMPHVCSGVPVNPWCSGRLTRVRACVAPSFRVALSLATGESYVSVTVSTGGKSQRFKAHGRRTRVRVTLGRRRAVRVRFLERIKVRGHGERISFTRIYHSC